MVDFQPFRGLRYTSAGGALSDLISPPYDVLSAEQVEELEGRSPHNVIRLEHPSVALAGAADPYAEAARLLAGWKKEILLRDESPAYYVHEQHFFENGQEKTRSVIYGLLRLVDWDEGTVLPHEYTMAGPKRDRLELMRALRANVSPLYLLYDDAGAVRRLLGQVEADVALAEAEADGERHELRALRDPAVVEALRAQFAGRRLYIADGHHRYETALSFRDEDGSDASRHVMVGLTAGNDPGLSIHGTHRLVGAEVSADGLHARLHALFNVVPAAERELQDALSGSELAVGVAGLDGSNSLHIIRARNVGAVTSAVGGDAPDSWKRLDVNIVQRVILGGMLGLDPEQPNQPGLTYVHSIDEAIKAVRSGAAALALLLRPVSPKQLFAVSDTGWRLPQKTTYFYPKLPTGLVMNLLD